MTCALLTGILIEQLDDCVLVEIDLEELDLEVDLLRCKALLDLKPAQLGEDMRRRSLIDPEWRLESR
jgi:hypothetical protein